MSKRPILAGILVGLISPGVRVYHPEDQPPAWRQARPPRTPRPERHAGRLAVVVALIVVGVLVVLLGVAQKSILLTVGGLALITGGAVVAPPR